MAANPLNLDVRGALSVDAQLALLELPPQLRRRLLNNVTKRVRSMSRKRVRAQQNLDGSPFEARKGSAKGKKKNRSPTFVAGSGFLVWRPHGDSNPGTHRERVMS